MTLGADQGLYIVPGPFLLLAQKFGEHNSKIPKKYELHKFASSASPLIGRSNAYYVRTNGT